MDIFVHVLFSFLNFDGEGKSFDVVFAKLDKTVSRNLSFCPVLLVVLCRPLFVENQEVEFIDGTNKVETHICFLFNFELEYQLLLSVVEEVGERLRVV